MTTSSLDIALDYLAFNPTHKLFPVAGKSPPCFPGWKDVGHKDAASNDPKQIRKWHRQRPGCAWAVEAASSGIVVLDADLKAGKHGQISLDMLELEYGPLPLTSTARTPSGGRHYRFKATDKVQHKFKIDGFATHLDSPAYTIIPGVTLPKGA